MRVQYTHVLFRNYILLSRLSQCHGSWSHYCDCELYLYTGGTSCMSSLEAGDTASVRTTDMCLQIVDPCGRRRTMLYTIPIMAIALVMASICFYRTSRVSSKSDRMLTPLSGLTMSTGGVLIPSPPRPYPSTFSTLVLVAMLVYVAGYAAGCGNIPWQQGELFRLEVRGIGTSVCTAVNWSVPCHREHWNSYND